jgi:hypothetical protein
VMSGAPDILGEIVGYRAWRIRTSVLQPPLLESLNDPFPWAWDDWTYAECDEDEGVPHACDPCRVGDAFFHHHCGIHAARDRGHLSRLRYNESHGTVVIGEVGLAGDVIVGTQGWRAEKARPLRLWLPHDRWELVNPLRAAYRVPVHLTNVLREGAMSGHRP